MPLNEIFVRAMAMFLLPYLICEILSIIGGLHNDALGVVLKYGCGAFAGIIMLGVAEVLLLPLMLPAIQSSPLFSDEILHAKQVGSVLETLLPNNIFSALAQGNFTGVILFIVVCGFMLQKVKGRENLLAAIEPIRILFTNIMELVIRYLCPVGIFAAAANIMGAAAAGGMERMLGLLFMFFTALIVNSFILFPGLLLCTTGIGFSRLWRIVRDPLILSFATGGLLITIPVLLSRIRSLVAEQRYPDSDPSRDMAPLEAIISIGMPLVSLGETLMLAFIPFAAWYCDKPLNLTARLEMLTTAVPASLGVAAAAVMQELPRVGIPANLIAVYFLHEEWTDRIANIETIMAIVTAVLLIYAIRSHTFRIRIGGVLVTLAATCAVAFLMGFAANRSLALILKDAGKGRELILSRASCIDAPEPEVLSLETLSAPSVVSLSDIKKRGVLRAGVITGALPWAYRNKHHSLVGYDIDLLKALARSLHVQLSVVEGTSGKLDEWLLDGRIDCAAGGIHGAAVSDGAFTKIPYQEVSIALVVPDHSMSDFQKALLKGSSKPLVLDYRASQAAKLDLQQSIQSSLTRHGAVLKTSYHPIQDPEEFFAAAGTSSDALITSAEEGAALAVVHPELTMLPVFHKSLSAEAVLVFASRDIPLLEYVRDWIREKDELDLLEFLRNHWILFTGNPSLKH